MDVLWRSFVTITNPASTNSHLLVPQCHRPSLCRLHLTPYSSVVELKEWLSLTTCSLAPLLIIKKWVSEISSTVWLEGVIFEISGFPNVAVLRSLAFGSSILVFKNSVLWLTVHCNAGQLSALTFLIMYFPSWMVLIRDVLCKSSHCDYLYFTFLIFTFACLFLFLWAVEDNGLKDFHYITMFNDTVVAACSGRCTNEGSGVLLSVGCSTLSSITVVLKNFVYCLSIWSPYIHRLQAWSSLDRSIQ